MGPRSEVLVATICSDSKYFQMGAQIGEGGDDRLAVWEGSAVGFWVQLHREWRSQTMDSLVWPRWLQVPREWRWAGREGFGGWWRKEEDALERRHGGWGGGHR